MTTEAVTFSKHKRLLQDTGSKTFTEPNALRRFRHFIEHSDWDEEILAQDAWIDKICIGAIIVASLYVVVLVSSIVFFR